MDLSLAEHKDHFSFNQAGMSLIFWSFLLFKAWNDSEGDQSLTCSPLATRLFSRDVSVHTKQDICESKSGWFGRGLHVGVVGRGWGGLRLTIKTFRTWRELWWSKNQNLQESRRFWWMFIWTSMWRKKPKKMCEKTLDTTRTFTAVTRTSVLWLGKTCWFSQNLKIKKCVNMNLTALYVCARASVHVCASLVQHPIKLENKKWRHLSVPDRSGISVTIGPLVPHAAKSPQS